MASKKQEISPKQPSKPMTIEQEAQWQAYAEKASRAPEGPKLELKDNGYNAVTPDEGKALLYLQLHNVSGMASVDGASHLIDQIVKVNKNGQVNGALAIAAEIQPQDAVEGMLVTQMIAAHNLAMKKTSAAIMGESSSLKQAEHASKVAMQAMRVFTAQVEALARWRSKGQQKIIVQHVQVNQGGQAVIGDVNNAGGNKG